MKGVFGKREFQAPWGDEGRVSLLLRWRLQLGARGSRRERYGEGAV